MSMSKRITVRGMERAGGGYSGYRAWDGTRGGRISSGEYSVTNIEDACVANIGSTRIGGMTWNEVVA